MKITALKSFVHTAGNYFVKVETDAGLYGLGEAGLKRRGHAIAEVVKGFESDLIGADPSRIEHLWQTMFRGGFFPGGVVQSSAVSAVDIALWDLKGKALGVPVYELLGGLTRERVACYPHIGERDVIERLVANCRQRQSEGWRFARWGLGDPTGEGAVFEPARAVRHRRYDAAIAIFGIVQVRRTEKQAKVGWVDRRCLDPHDDVMPGWRWQAFLRQFDDQSTVLLQGRQNPAAAHVAHPILLHRSSNR